MRSADPKSSFASKDAVAAVDQTNATQNSLSIAEGSASHTAGDRANPTADERVSHRASESAAPALSWSRRRVLAALLHPRQMRESAAVMRQTALRSSVLAGLQAAIATVLVLTAVLLSPWPHLAGYAALGTLITLFARFAPRSTRSKILLQCTGLQVSAVLVTGLLSAAGLPHYAMLGWLVLSTGLYLALAMTIRCGAPGPLIFVFAVGASLAPGQSLSEVFAHSAATLLAAIAGLIICALTDRWRPQPSAARPLPTEPIVPMRLRLGAALRAMLAALAAVLVCVVIDASHPAWAAMGALAVMQGAGLHIQMNRALQRMIGSVVGSLLAYLLLSAAPTLASVIFCLCVLQIATEMVIGANYAFGQALVTPMALLMTWLAAPEMSASALAYERMIDTVLGAAIAVLVAVLVSSFEQRQHLALHRLGPSALRSGLR